MARVYRTILARAPAPPNVVFLDTPAGFEPNADAIALRAVEFFSRHHELSPEVATWKRQDRATALELEAALDALRRADFILAGPGSPSYAIRNLQDTPVWQVILDRFLNGAHLALASAAAIAVSASALPVYEIYKVGAALHWLAGLNLFAALGMSLAIVPHWNNSEGGTYDTRFCYMGQDRFLELEKQLPDDTIVLGIDEHTACIFDASAQECVVMGAGNVTLRGQGREWVFAAGETFPFARLRPQSNLQPSNAPSPQTGSGVVDFADARTRQLLKLARDAHTTQGLQVRRDLISRTHDTAHPTSTGQSEAQRDRDNPDIAAFVELLIETREQLRAANQYDLADEIRTRLARLNIVLQDTSGGTTWHKI